MAEAQTPTTAFPSRAIDEGSRDAASANAGGLASGPRDTASGRIRETPAEPMDRLGTEGAIDGPRLTPQGRTGEDSSGEDETDPMGGVKTGQTDKAEG